MPFRHAAVAAPNSDNWIRTEVLVLNASYEALTEIETERAVVLLISGVAETVAAREPHFPIRSKHLEIALPETIRLLCCWGPPRAWTDGAGERSGGAEEGRTGVNRVPAPERSGGRVTAYLEHRVLVHDESRATLAAVLRRDNHRCGYCAGWARTVDHIRPRSRGGPNTWANLIAVQHPQGGPHARGGRHAAAVGAQGPHRYGPHPAEGLERPDPRTLTIRERRDPI